MSNLILFDETCPFYQNCILFIIKKDKKNQFLFSDLHGKTAHSMSSFLKMNDQESIIFIENFNTSKQKVLHRSKAVFRILYLLGGIYSLIGWKYVLPSFLFDWLYNLIGRNRKHLCKKNTSYKKEYYKKRFLP